MLFKPDFVLLVIKLELIKRRVDILDLHEVVVSLECLNLLLVLFNVSVQVINYFVLGIKVSLGHNLLEDVGLHSFDCGQDVSCAQLVFPFQVRQVQLFVLLLKCADSSILIGDLPFILHHSCLPA